MTIINRFKNIPNMKVDFSFFNRHCVDVAHDLIGKTLVFGGNQGLTTETESIPGEG